MPLRRLLMLITFVIGLAAATVAGFVTLTDGLADTSMVILGAISIVSLLASLALRRFGQSDTAP